MRITDVNNYPPESYRFRGIFVSIKDNYNAHCVFSTYPTMMNCIDSIRDDEGKLFTCGHFDLIICDEAHRSIYNKYRDIFTYFDAPLVGLTATPKDEIDKNTYEIFELGNGSPTYGYELAQAVNDGYLVDFLSVETELKFLTKGIVYDEFSDDDKEQYESTFVDEDGELPEKIAPSALNNWVMNVDTKQIYFVNQIVEYIVRNGVMKDFSILQEPPFTDNGSVVEIFSDLSIWQSIKKAIESINKNAVA